MQQEEKRSNKILFFFASTAITASGFFLISTPKISMGIPTGAAKFNLFQDLREETPRLKNENNMNMQVYYLSNIAFTSSRS